MFNSKIKKALRISLRVLLTLCIVLFFTMAGAYFVVQRSDVQTFLVKKASQWLSDKLQMEVSVGKVKAKFFDTIHLENVLIKDAKGREMIKVPALDLNYNLTNIQDSTNINLDKLYLENPIFYLVAEKDGSMNFDALIERIEKLTAPKDTNNLKPDQNVPFTIDEAVVANGTFRYEDPSEPRFKDGTFEYNHFKISELNANLHDFVILGDTIAFRSDNIRGMDYASKLHIKKLETQFLYCRSAMLLGNLNAAINQSKLQNFLGFYYSSPAAFSDFNKQVSMKARLRESQIHAHDLALFAPLFKKYEEIWRIDVDFDGTVADFKLKNLDLKFGEKSHIVGDLAFVGLPEIAQTTMDFQLKPSVIELADARKYIADSSLFNQIQAFERFAVQGNFKGKYNDFSTKTNIETALGKVDATLAMQIFENQPIAYKTNLNVQDFNLGKLLDEPTLGKVSFSGDIEGKDFSLQKSDIRLDGTIKNLDFDGYIYKKTIVRGNLKNGFFDGRVIALDTNLNFDLVGKFDLQNPTNLFNVYGKIQNANLQALGYANQDIRLKTELAVNFKGNTVDDLIGEGQILNGLLTLDKQQLAVDTLFVRSSLVDSLRNVHVESVFLNADLVGKFTPSSTINDLNTVLKEYGLYFFGNEQKRKEYYEQKALLGNRLRDSQLKYDITLKNAEPLFTFFVPDLYISKGAKFAGNFSVGNTYRFNLNAKVDTLRYDDLFFYQDSVEVITSKFINDSRVLNSIVAGSSFQQFASAPPTDKLYVDATWGDDGRLNFDGTLRSIIKKDTSSAEMLGSLKFTPEGFDIRFKPQTRLNLIDRTWGINPQNHLTFIGNEICFDRFELLSKGQKAAINGRFSEDSTQVAIVDIQDFELNTFKPLLGVDVEGVVQGNFNLFNFYRSPTMSGDITIDELVYQQFPIGTITGSTSWDDRKRRLNVRSDLIDIRNQRVLVLTGNYDPKESQNPLDLRLRLQETNLNIFEPFLDSLVSEMAGKMNGLVGIRGTLEKPTFSGSASVKGGNIKVNMLGTSLKFEDKVNINNGDFELANFKLKDAEGNTAKLSGGLYSGGNGEYLLQLNADIADKFVILNTNEESENADLFYGKGVVGGNFEFTGTLNSPIIRANVTSKAGTKITIPLDASESVSQSEDNSIQFVSQLLKKQNAVDSLPNLDFDGVKMDFTLDFTPDAECEILIDRQTGHKMNAFGNGTLYMDIDTRGDFAMNGSYIISKGLYNFSVQSISRKFDLTQGGSIRWLGDPYEADINISAVYQYPNLSIDPIVLGNVASSTQTNRVPTIAKSIVSVNLSNKLSSPKISYNIDFSDYPNKHREQIEAFKSRLQTDEQLLSQNVSSILLLNQLFPQDITGQFGQQLLLDNISQLISNQISGIASKIDKNLQLGLNFNSSTQSLINNLNLQLSYRINNRWRFSGSSTFMNRTGQEQLYNNSLFYTGEIEYLLTDDGKLRLKFYNRSIPSFYLSNITGTVNGMSLQHTNSFNNIFKRKSQFPLSSK